MVRLGPPLNIKIVFRNIRKTIRRSRDRLNRLKGISLYMYIFAVTIKKPYHLRKSISVTLYTTISSYIFASSFVRRHAILVWLVDVIKWKHFFRVTGPLWKESTGGFPSQSQWRGTYFLWSAPEHRNELTIETLVIWDAMALIKTWL